MRVSLTRTDISFSCVPVLRERKRKRDEDCLVAEKMKSKCTGIFEKSRYEERERELAVLCPKASPFEQDRKSVV